MALLKKITPFCLFLLLLLQLSPEVSSISDEESALFSGYHHECVAVSGVDGGILESAFTGNIVDDAHFKRYISCFFTKGGFQADNGDMRFDVIKSHLDHFAAHVQDGRDPMTLITSCESQKLTGDGPDETAFLNFKCLMAKM